MFVVFTAHCLGGTARVSHFCGRCAIAAATWLQT